MCSFFFLLATHLLWSSFRTRDRTLALSSGNTRVLTARTPGLMLFSQSLGQEDPLENCMHRGAWRATVLGVTVRHDRGVNTVLSLVKNLPPRAGDTGKVGSIPALGSSPGEGNGNSLQYSCLEHPME